MWFFIGAVVVIALGALWFRRTNLYRARHGGLSVKPGQGGFDASGWSGGAHGSLDPPRGNSRD
jgi:hypothetical protein